MNVPLASCACNILSFPRWHLSTWDREIYCMWMNPCRVSGNINHSRTSLTVCWLGHTHKGPNGPLWTERQAVEEEHNTGPFSETKEQRLLWIVFWTRLQAKVGGGTCCSFISKVQRIMFSDKAAWRPEGVDMEEEKVFGRMGRGGLSHSHCQIPCIFRL